MFHCCYKPCNIPSLNFLSSYCIKSVVFISLLLTYSLFALDADAAGKVNYLNVDGDYVHFATTEAKTSASPECVIAGTNEHFTTSLKTESGRAIYSLLITAMTTEQGVSVTSAQDCNDVAGIERAKAVQISGLARSFPSVLDLLDEEVGHFVETFSAEAYRSTTIQLTGPAIIYFFNNNSMKVTMTIDGTKFTSFDAINAAFHISTSRYQIPVEESAEITISNSFSSARTARIEYVK